jgi:tetratricopeptide (TPR) repeat protein
MIATASALTIMCLSLHRKPALLLTFLCCLALTVPVSAGEPPWLRISSAHFSLLTDAGDKQGREILLRFEQMRSMFSILLMRPKLNMPEPLDIIAVKDGKEYAELAYKGQNPKAFFLPGEDRNYIVVNASEETPWHAVQYEFARLYMNYNYPPTPAWFDEGFAEYFAGMRLDNKVVQLGSDPALRRTWRQDLIGNQTKARYVPKSFTELLKAPIWLATPDLFTMRLTPTTYENSRHTLFNAQSWIVVHYLINKEKLSQTGTYFDLVENQKLPVEQAVQKAYGMTIPQFDKEVKDYFHSLEPLFKALDLSTQPGEVEVGGVTSSMAAPVGPGDLGMNAQTVTVPQALALQAEMAERVGEHRDASVQELKALVADPKMESAIAHRALAWDLMQNQKFEEATEELGKATDIDRNDAWSRYYLALVKYHAAQGSGQEFHSLGNMMQDLRAVLDWYPDFAQAYAMLATARIEGGGTSSALEAIRAAMRLSPRNESYSLILAKVYMAGKHWDDATDVLTRLKSSRDPQIVKAAKKNLEDLPTLKKYGILPQESANELPPDGKTATPPPAQTESDTDEREAKAPPAPEKAPDKRPVLFAKGTLVKVDCAKPAAAVMTVNNGKRSLKLRTEDYKTMLLIGADEFSCAWRNRNVSVNYKAGGSADGDLVSVEIN